MIVQDFFHRTWETIAQDAKYIKDETNSILAKSNARIIQPALQTIKGYSPSFQKGLVTLENIAIRAFKIFASIVLFSVQPTFFLVGAAIAATFPEAMRSSIDRISKVWDSLPLVIKVLAFFPFPFAWPSYCLIAAPFVGANAYLYLEDKAGIQRQSPPPQPSGGATPQLPAMALPRSGIFVFIPPANAQASEIQMVAPFLSECLAECFQHVATQQNHQPSLQSLNCLTTGGETPERAPSPAS